MANKIKLYCKTHGVREFDPEHASRLLAIPENIRGGWIEYSPPETDETKLNDNDGGNTKTGRKTGKRSGNTKGD